jgi:uncharacterized membrane protein (TIGR02234 family)
MTSVPPDRRRARLAGLLSGSAARELLVTLVLGAIGAGLVFLACRPGWAHVRTIPPRPLPASNVIVTGAAMLPYADALVLAGLATLAAILATSRVLRRIAGALLAAIGAALAAAAFTVSTAAAISAAEAGIGPATNGAGSVMNGSGSAAPVVPNVAGTAPQVTLTAGGWQAIAVVGALAMITAGVLVICRARRMTVMSSRYDAPASAGARRAAARAAGTGTGPGEPADSASMWEALSRGHDPTTGASRADS